MGKLFGTDGIRGRVNIYPMTVEMATHLGRAVTHYFSKPGHRPRIIIGRDTRLSGDMLEGALAAGICSMGGMAITAGVMPTAGIAYLASSMRVDAGIVISASHNPYYDNGFKIFSRDGFKLPDETEAHIENMLIKPESLMAQVPDAKEVGRIQKMNDAAGRYIVFLKNAFPRNLSLEGMKIVLDCANGACYQIAPATFSELGADVTTIHDRPDGHNINVDCGSQHPESLVREVMARKADVGFAFDGDGDRVIAVDEKGNILTGDRIMVICARWLKDMRRLKNNLVVRTVMSNFGLSLALDEMGIEYVTTDVGDRYVLEAMLKTGAILGGEDSGHIIFLDLHTSGDGILTALQLLAAMKAYNLPLSTCADWMKVYPQILINVEVRERKDLKTIPELVETVKKIEDSLGKRGRVLVRYSGTQNLCRVMVEGPSPEETRTAAEVIARVVEKNIGKINQ
ncbi:MAG: phosphoglucosamine mutase [Syntrophales bacterium]|nr:phosphoglucosamine mutase [Syntrophales bacterium]